MGEKGKEKPRSTLRSSEAHPCPFLETGMEWERLKKDGEGEGGEEVTTTAICPVWFTASGD